MYLLYSIDMHLHFMSYKLVIYLAIMNKNLFLLMLPRGTMNIPLAIVLPYKHSLSSKLELIKAVLSV